MNEDKGNTFEEQYAYLRGFERGAREVIRNISTLQSDLTADLMTTIFREQERLNLATSGDTNEQSNN